MTLSELVADWISRVAQVAVPFEARWTWLSLRRVDAALAEALGEQRSLFREACVVGSPRDVATHGAAMCRGYLAAIAAMEAAGAEDDAYRIGRCPRTGTVVAIGEQVAATDRVRELHGEAAILITPDEVASLFASVEVLKGIAAIKRKFPGAEVVDRHQGEGT